MSEINKKEQSKLQVTNDLVFQRIFGKVGNEEITKGFLESILGIEIKSLELDRNKRMQTDPENKMGRLDVKAELNDGTIVNIEMQATEYKYMADRVVFYNSLSFVERLKKGNVYSNLSKVITILITDYGFYPARNIPKCHTKWNIREQDYPKEILTPIVEYHVIELSKFNQEKIKGKEGEWIKFIKGKEMKDMEKVKKYDDALKKAIEEYEYLVGDEKFREEYNRRIYDLLDQISYYTCAKREGREEGREEGRKEGRKQGKEENKRDVAKKLIELDIDIEKIIQATGLTKEEIEKLKK